MITFERDLTVAAALFLIGTSARMSRDPFKTTELVDLNRWQGL